MQSLQTPLKFTFFYNIQMNLTIAKIRASPIREGEHMTTIYGDRELLLSICPGLGKIWITLVLKTEYGENNVLWSKRGWAG